MNQNDARMNQIDARNINTAIHKIRGMLTTSDCDDVDAIMSEVVSLVTHYGSMKSQNADQALGGVTELTSMFAWDAVVVLLHDDDQVSVIDMSDLDVQEIPFVVSENFESFLASCRFLDDKEFQFLATVVWHCQRRTALSASYVVKTCVASMCQNSQLSDFLEKSLHQLLDQFIVK